MCLTKKKKEGLIDTCFFNTFLSASTERSMENGSSASQPRVQVVTLPQQTWVDKRLRGTITRICHDLGLPCEILSPAKGSSGIADSKKPIPVFEEARVLIATVNDTHYIPARIQEIHGNLPLILIARTAHPLLRWDGPHPEPAAILPSGRGIANRLRRELNRLSPTLLAPS